MLDIFLLKAFKAVDEHRSFTAAANHLGVDQPRISRLIRRLEQQLGFKLFMRSTRNIQTTAEGVEFLSSVDKLLGALQGAERSAYEIRQRHRSQLRLGAPQFSAEIAIRASIVNEFMAHNRDYRIDISHVASGKQLDALRKGDFELVFALGPYVLPADMEALVIAQAQLCVGLPPDHDLACLEKIPLALLKGQRVAVLPRRSMAQSFDAWFTPLADAGLRFVEAPEPITSTLLQFGHLNRLPVLLYRWPGKNAESDVELVWRPLMETSFFIELAVVRLCDEKRSYQAAKFWDLAARYVLPTAMGTDRDPTTV